MEGIALEYFLDKDKIGSNDSKYEFGSYIINDNE